jgi:hypothetical protein
VARSVTRAVLRARAQQLANVENDPNVTAAEINELINLHLTSVYDLLVGAGPADYYAAETIITVVPGVIASGLPADFMQLVGVFAHETTDIRRPVDPMQERDRSSFKACSSAWSVTLEYIPACPTMTLDADTFDGVDGWDELISAKVARDILAKREGDVSVVMAIMAQTEARIRTRASPRDRGGPKYIMDVECSSNDWPRSVRVDAYRLRAGNLELFESLCGA